MPRTTNSAFTLRMFFVLCLTLLATTTAWYVWHKLRQADLNATLLEAVEAHSLPTVHNLLEAGANPNATIPPSLVTSLLSADVGTESIMVQAGEEGQASVVAALLDKGGNVNTFTPHLHVTPLMVACKTGDIDTIKLLLSRGADLYARDYRNRTALHYAVDNDKVEVVKLILKTSCVIG